MAKINIYYLVIAIFLGVYLTVEEFEDQNWQAHYERKHAGPKLDYLWDKVTSVKQSGPAADPITITKMTVPTWVGGMDFGLVGSSKTDFKPQGVVKGIHAVGVTCKGKFDWNDKVTDLGLTGGFRKDGADNVIARFSQGLPSLTGDKIANSAFKILRDGMWSGNLFGAHAIEPQHSFNWFEYGQCSHVPVPKFSLSIQGLKNTALGKIFTKAGTGNYANLLGSSDVAKWDKNGKEEESVKSPYVVCFQPPASLREKTKNYAANKFDSKNGEIFAGLNCRPEDKGCQHGIAKGTVMYHVYAALEPMTPSELQAAKDAGQNPVVYIGDFVTTDDCTTSKFGDEHLFFKHTYWNDEMENLGQPESWKKVNDNWSEYEGISRYEPFFQPEHKLTHDERRRLFKPKASH